MVEPGIKISAGADIWACLGEQQSLEELMAACDRFFLMADVNEDGKLSVSELKVILKEHLNRKYDNLRDEFFKQEAEHWISAHYDTDGDNKISLQEFKDNYTVFWNTMQAHKIDFVRP